MAPQSVIHTVVQGILHWKPSDGFGALPCEGDKYIDDVSGEEVEIATPQWDERVDTIKNVNWIGTVTALIERNIKVSDQYTCLTQRGADLKRCRPTLRGMTS